MELSTRREILAALLGMPMAAAACRRSPEFAYDGRFVDEGEGRSIGHAWRDAQLSAASPLPDRTARVVVLGAGAAGLVAAWRLVRAGVRDLVVLDVASAPGGTAIGGHSAVSAYPWGAHYLPAPTADNPALVELLADMGVVVDRGADRSPDHGPDRGGQGAPTYDEAVLCSTPQERVFYKGRWYPGLLPGAALTSEDRRQLARFRRLVGEWVAWRDADGRRAFTIPVARCSDDPRCAALDALSMREWLRRRQLDSPAVLAAVDYACRDDFGARPDEVSAWYGLHYFAARTPAPDEDSAPFLTWPKGNGQIVDHLVARIGAERMRARTLVTGIRAAAAPARWVVNTFDGATGRPRTWRAAHVVCALPSFMRARLFGEDRKLAGTYRPTYGAWMVANLHLRGRPDSLGFEPAWDNVIFDSRSLGYVIATHQGGSAYGPTVWTWYLPLTDPDAKAGREKLEQLSWAEAARTAVGELDVAHQGLAKHLARVDVRRWGHAMVRPAPGLAFGAARRSAAESKDGMHFAHSDLSGVALFEEAFYHGDRAAQEVLRDMGRSG